MASVWRAIVNRDDRRAACGIRWKVNNEVEGKVF
jgi:hypothetical protein